MPVRLFSVLAVLLLTACASVPANAPPTVAGVDLRRYQGTWYEIASFPAWFQEGCTATTAEYRLREDGKVAVVNRCREGSPDGRESVADALARLDPAHPDGSRLLVSFFPLVEGWYWVLALDAEYRWSLVGTPDRRYLWVLSRTPVMDERTYGDIVARAAALGFDTSRLRRTLQPG